MTRSTPFFLCALLALPAGAETIYKCTDASGGMLISNTRVDKNCRALPSAPDSGAGPVAAPKARVSGAAANPTPAGFPKVQEDTQKSRDNDRRHILSQELAGEQRSLEVARKDLAGQEASKASPDLLAPYRDRVAQHERNIQAIQKELGNLK